MSKILTTTVTVFHNVISDILSASFYWLICYIQVTHQETR